MVHAHLDDGPAPMQRLIIQLVLLLLSSEAGLIEPKKGQGQQK